VFQFITNRSFFVNLLVAIVIGLLVVFVFFQLLDRITQHGKYIKVPEVKGKSVDEARNLLEQQGFQVEVQDSIYYDSLPRLSVVKQSPVAQEMVKLGDTSQRPDFAVGSVLEQIYNGNQVKPGTKVPMGSRVSLVLGGGIKQTELPVPVLLGLTFAEAKVLLESNDLLLGAVVVDGAIADSSAAFVIRQNPPVRDEEGRPIRIRGGQLVDLWISMDRSKIDSIQRPKPVIEQKTENEY
jgi:beta-lactam-binding protein with PASTA domain